MAEKHKELNNFIKQKNPNCQFNKRIRTMYLTKKKL